MASFGLFTSTSCWAIRKKRRKKGFGLAVYLVGLTGELTPAELALDLALGAVMLQVVGQVAACQLDGAAVGAGNHIEGAGGEVSLRETEREKDERVISQTCTLSWHLVRPQPGDNTTYSIQQIGDNRPQEGRVHQSHREIR